MPGMELSKRMKLYEAVTDNRLTRRTPVIIRLDGNAFHTFTKGLDKPFDDIFIEGMQYVCYNLSLKIQNCKFIYCQSDEISLLLTDWDDLDTGVWFDNRIQKMCSISAAMATKYFNKFIYEKLIEWKPLVDYYNKHNIWKNDEELKKYSIPTELYYKWERKLNTAMFDSRVYNIPISEVCNYFIWRQQDAIRNSLQMLAQSKFSHKELDGKKSADLHEMLYQKDKTNWNDLPTYKKQGLCYYKVSDDETKQGDSNWVIDRNIPIFTQDRDYIEKYLKEC